MSDTADTVIDDETLTLSETPEESATDAESGAVAEGAEGTEEVAASEGEAAEGAEAEELVVSIGDEAQPEPEEGAPAWVKELRKQNRELVRAQRAKDAEIARLKAATAPAPQVLGPKPTLAACDYDEEKFEAELEKWHTKSREADEQQRKQAEAAEQAKAKWQSRLEDVSKAGTSLKVRDYEEAGEAFDATFSLMQQGIIVNGPEDAKDAALLRYALGKNPGVAKKLAAIDDPVRFAFAVARVLNKDLSVKPKTAPPPPDRVVRSGVPGAVVGDSKLAELHRKAQETGNFDAYLKYKREKAAKAA